MEQRIKYRQKFMQEAVQLTRQPGPGITQVAKDLGLNAAILGRWCREARQRGYKAFPGTGTPHDQELARLKRELALITRDRDVLQEAAVFSPSDWVVDPAPTGTWPGYASRVDGGLATKQYGARYSPFGSRDSIYRTGVSTVPQGPWHRE